MKKARKKPLKKASPTLSDILDLHHKLTEQAAKILATKNHDYSNESDAFRNFRAFGGFGILVRLSDKLARLLSFEEKGEFAVEDEKLADTVQDVVNYAVLYYAYKLLAQNTKEKQ